MNNDKFVETFKEEAYELLGNLEATLLELEENPGDKELLSAVFRVMHTIKGSAAMFGLEHISKFSHEVESILSALRDGKLSVSKELVGDTLMARDLILGLLEKDDVSSGPLPDELVQFLEDSPQPNLARVLAFAVMNPEKRPKELRVKLEIQPVIVAFLKAVVEELDRALRPQVD